MADKEVSKEEFEQFIKNYPRKLEVDICGISEPPLISYNDFTIDKRWPYSVVARTWKYSDIPGECYYTPENERKYYIKEN